MGKLSALKNKVDDLLDMRQEARMERAREMGFKREAYHSTYSDFDEFDMDRVDIGVHTGTKGQAESRLRDVQNQRDGSSSFARPSEYDNGANTMPLLVRDGKSLELPDVGAWNDSEKVLSAMEDVPELRGRFDGAWEELGVKDQYEEVQDWIDSPENREMLDEIRQALVDDGYETVKYKNAVEETYLGGNTNQKFMGEWRGLHKKLIDLKSQGRDSIPMPTDEQALKDPDSVRRWVENREVVYTPEIQAEIDRLEREMSEITRGRHAIEENDSYSFISLNPSNIRSVNAAFDPAKKDSSNLLAGLGAAGVGVSSMLGSNQADAMPTDTITAEEYPLLDKIGYHLSRFDTPIGKPFEGLGTYLQKLGEPVSDKQVMHYGLLGAGDFSLPAAVGGMFTSER